MTTRKRMAPVTVVALGGNALIREGELGEVEQQRRHIREAVEHLPMLLKSGTGILITHGNGPVVGQLLLQNEAGRKLVPEAPLDVCDADSEGSIGYLVQQELTNRLCREGDRRNVVSVITQVLVDAGDPGFRHPSKPVGPFYSHEEAIALRRDRGWTILEDAGRGYRRVVPSPVPLEVVELDAIRLLLAQGIVVIAAGGGGIPVVRDGNGNLRGIEAVVDKDRSSALLAKALNAGKLIFLTAVDCVYRRFSLPGQEPLPVLTVRRALHLHKDGEFAEGSMGPKIQAAVEYLQAGGKEVLITSPESLPAALKGQSGTRIIP